MINKKQIIMLIISFLCLVGLLSVIYYFQNNSNQISITNTDKYLKSIPNSRKNDLSKAIYSQLKYMRQLNNYKNDTVIRSESYIEKYDKDTNTYASNFIIDIPSIKASYRIGLAWSKDSKVILSGSNLSFSCVEKSEIIYKDFNCKKSLGLLETTDDEIIQYLPYSVSNYSIIIKSNIGDKISLYIDIFLDLSDTENNKTNTSITKYKLAANNWIKSKNLNPDSYIINYRIHGN